MCDRQSSAAGRAPRGVLALVVGVVVSAAADTRADAPGCPPAPPSYVSLEAPVADRSGPQVGRGAYSYRFVVRDPRSGAGPFRRGRYQVSLAYGGTFPDGSRSFRGRTDARGRTATFRFAQPIIGDEAWSVWPLVGRGEMGETLQLVPEGGDSCARLAGWDYVVDIPMGPIFCGSSLPDGLSARFMTPKPTTLSIFTDIPGSTCRRLERVLNPIMAARSPQARIAGLSALVADPRFADASDLLEEKLEALRFRYASLAQLRRALARELDQAPRESHAEILNHVAFSLLEQTPPRFLAFADGLLDRSLALRQDIYNTDSKGWSLHLLRRDEEALGWVARSLALFGTTCTESERQALPIAFVHRGVILWALERKPEALDDWAQASLLDSTEDWVNALPDGADVEAKVRTRAEQLRATAAVTPRCSTVTKEGEDGEARPSPVEQTDAGVPGEAGVAP
jgi:hypothetical protein